MKREIITTNDGSSSIFLPEWNESYHSKFGAIQEAKHVFIKNGLDLIQDKEVSILEIGFGTGLNAFITLIEAKKRKQKINYIGVEAYPVPLEEIELLNYPEQLGVIEEKDLFLKMHQTEWEEIYTISDYFAINKRKQFFDTITDENTFELIYFDAFGFRVQPELWTEKIFQKMFNALNPGGILVTYACRTVIKNAMLAVGFTIEKLPGAPGKREMLRAKKPIDF
ncbi:tRNA (5-methylaminomethyl-2-thiouridine)(34)-methyltransferase MnmD [Flavobacterium jejuense]|uniref:tRNA (5-methylaminomethyl-2-thiouridine)(34)-methyltransferase MnmD n=1 Tax=Flavobacterium jejuense TaxID=1544455 RepID=A0ABX0IQV8_9FLAO|nr:tRNA (5-methylaminomethyl-2-thiouridine)(34)-methyltransferase MnmD [Flavobacterium jejuense]NHN24225.1 tRNA (5-methylaminomethyl-2-thiouridine)(34)-methyltransferase MnmD [Flavobacterium jejuense]